MKKSFKVILDCDDVLYECNKEAVKKLNKEIGSSYSIYDITSWGLLGNDLDIRLKYFNDPEFIKEMPLMEGAKDFVKKLSKKAEIIIMTNIPLYCASERAESIIKNFPEIKKENIIIGGRKDMIKADLMLDDCIDNLMETNVDFPVLMQQPWNYKGNAGIMSVNDYGQFLELIDTIKRRDEEPSAFSGVCLTGPSGAGKGKLARELEKTNKFTAVPVYTTRSTNKFITLSKEDFIKNKKSFDETSMYMGEFYGIKYDDVLEIEKSGKIPLFTIDINGLMSIKQRFSNTLTVFVKDSKINCIKSILNKNMDKSEKAERILAIDSEAKNEELCDITFNKNDDISKITSKILCI